MKSTEYIEHIIRKLGVGNLGADHIQHLFLHLDQYADVTVEKDDSKGSLVNLLRDLASSFPSFFISSGDTLTALLNSSDPAVVDAALYMVTDVGPLFTDDTSLTKSFKKPLADICANGTPKQSKYAVRGLWKLLSTSESKTVLTKVAKVRRRSLPSLIFNSYW